MDLADHLVPVSHPHKVRTSARLVTVRTKETVAVQQRLFPEPVETVACRNASHRDISLPDRGQDHLHRPGSAVQVLSAVAWSVFCLFEILVRQKVHTFGRQCSYALSK